MDSVSQSVNAGVTSPNDSLESLQNDSLEAAEKKILENLYKTQMKLFQQLVQLRERAQPTKVDFTGND